MKKEMSGGEAVVASLLAHGVDTLYALPGVQSDHLFNAVFDTGGRMRVVHTRHEQGAGYMALGAALATGRPAAYSVVPGPGFLNTTAALSTAYATGARVLCLTGQIASSKIGKRTGQLHEIENQSVILAQLTKWSTMIDTPEAAPQAVGRAMSALMTGRSRPVGLELPPDMLARTAAIEMLPAAAAAPAPVVPSSAAIDEAAQLLAKAKSPIIWVGGGAIDAADEVKDLAERLDAPVVAFRLGRGILDNRHDLSVTTTAAHRLWPSCDLVIAVGTRFQYPQSFGSDAGLKVIRIDCDPEELTVLPPANVTLTADAKAALTSILAQLPANAPRRPGWRETIRKAKAEAAARLATLEPQMRYLSVIRDCLPDDGVLVDEMTQLGYVARLAYETRKPRTHLCSGYQGTLGYGAATAIGAKHALGSTPVVSINGDGGFMFNVQELATAVRHHIPVVFIVFNDNAYGNVRRMQQELYGNRVIATDLVNPDFVRLAGSFGIESARVTSPEALRPALDTAIASGAPRLIEVPVGDMPSPWPFINLPKVRGA